MTPLNDLHANMGAQLRDNCLFLEMFKAKIVSAVDG